MRALVVLTFLLGLENAYGRAGTGDGSSKYKSEKTLDGLCTDTNQDEPYYKEGYCQSLAEQFNKNDCMKDTLEKLRKLSTGQGMKQADGKYKHISLPFSCNGDKPNQNLEKLAETNPSKYSYVCMQWYSMLMAQRSGWDVLKDEDNGGKGPGGFAGLNLGKGNDQDMDNQKYACGCKEQVSTTSGQSGVTVEGRSPGPLDGHHSMTCGSYMVFKSMLDDKSGQGKQPVDEDKPDGPKKPVGVTKILPEVTNDTEDDPKAEKANEWRRKKMETFCKQFWKSSETDPWKRQLIDDVDGSQLTNKPPRGETQQ